MRLNQKVAIITGAASGIGRATAILFAKEGAKIVVADTNIDMGNETVKTIQENGGEAVFSKTNVTKADEVKQMVQLAVDRFNKLDILYNNAGITSKITPTDELTEEEFDKLFAVNMKGIFLGTKYAIPEMKKNGRGVIINTASIGAVRPRIGLAGYSASKGAAIAFSQSLALELAKENIRVVVINPVVVDTPMNDIRDKEKISEAYKKTIPLGRIAMADDIAYAALYLASDEASMVTGASFNIDGGRGI